MLSFNSTHPRILNHSPIAVGERLVPVVPVQLGFYLQEGNRHFVVRDSLPFMSLSHSFRRFPRCPKDSSEKAPIYHRKPAAAAGGRIKIRRSKRYFISQQGSGRAKD